MILFLYVYEPFALYLSVSWCFFFFFDSNLGLPLPYGCYQLLLASVSSSQQPQQGDTTSLDDPTKL